MNERTFLFELVTSCLIRGEREPIAFAVEGIEALREGIALERRLGDLVRAFDELLELTYWLEGRGDSPRAARAIRVALIAEPEVRGRIGVESEPELREEEKRRARRRVRPVADWRVTRAIAAR